MMTAHVEKSLLKGTIRIPSSKSHTLRAILFGFMGKGKTVIYDPLSSPDTEAMIQACRLLGGKIEIHEGKIEIEGVNGKLAAAEDVINAGNSGQVLRFIGALAGISPFPVVLTGDSSIRHNRPVLPLLTGLSQWGAKAESLRRDGHAPILIQGPIKSGKARIDGADSQPVSGLLIASAFSEGPMELFVENPGEKPWVNLTLSWLTRLGISFEREGFSYYKVYGNCCYQGFTYQVPGDFSSCAFPLVAALLTRSEITLENLAMDDAQGDKQLLPILEQMGARFEFDPILRQVHIKPFEKLQGTEIDVNDLIDATPILAVVGCFAEGETRIKGASIARKKECDRLACVTHELRKMGADIDEHEDGLTIRPTRLKGTIVQAHADHRLAMALAVAGLAAEGQTTILGSESVAKSYREFFSHLKGLGAKVME